MRLHKYKQILAGLLDYGISDRLVKSQLKSDLPFVRAVNYHGTSNADRASFEKQLQFFSQHFAPVSKSDLLGLKDGVWEHERPGLLISFDDGLRNNFEVAAPLLEQYGFVGWFFIPAAFPDVPADSQREFCQRQQIDLGYEPAPGERIAMTWDEIKQLENKHVVGCHTLNHVRLREDLDSDVLRAEIEQSKLYCEEKLGHTVDSFCWVGGQQNDYSKEAAEIIKQAGYALSFMTNSEPIRPGYNALQLQRTHIEAGWDLPIVKLQLSGLIDFKYKKKREYVNALTNV